MRLTAALVFAAFLGSCAMIPWQDNEPDAPSPPPAPRTTWIVGQSGHAIGQATFTPAPTGLLIRLEFLANVLPPGWHGAHVHQIGDCSDFAAGFMAAGVHEGQVAQVQHGLMNPRGPEAGDLPNLFVPQGGAPFAVEFFATRLTLAQMPHAGAFSLMDDNGAAVIIHDSPDNHLTIPSGGRIACAALTPTP